MDQLDNIQNLIYVIRGQRVMLDFDLARLYQVETKALNQSFDRLKVIYKKVGNNESQAFGVWQQLSESERTAAFAHTQRLQGDMSLRSYLYVYLRDKEWMKAM